ncbi:MAG: LacI family DNA-binding transcriptional regulator [Asticcacaulis sp.]
MADIAKLAGVSLASVSRALSGSPLVPEPQRQRILAIAEEHGYAVNQAARNLRLQSTRTIGLVLPMGHETEQQVTDPFQLELIGHLSEAVFRRGYDLLMSKTLAPQPGWLKTLVQSHRFDSMLVLGQSDQHDALNTLARSYDPMVVWGERLPDQSYCTVGVDNRQGGYLATEHLISRGRKKILFLGPVGVPEVTARLEGYREALAASGHSVTAQNVIDCHFTPDAAIETARSLVSSRRKFDAVFAASDVIALAMMTALIEAGRSVPEDVAVCGFDDVAMSRNLSPPLTTVRQDLNEGARTMVELLFRRMAGDKTSSATIAASLIVRSSS